MFQVLTANRLIDGEVVYLGPDGSWVEELAAARLFDSKVDAEASLAVGAQAEHDQKIVHAYLFDIKQTVTGMTPVKQREIIRAAGPTVRRDLGKQAAV